jgi:fructoselysine-6-P-deglycase FrlB-like protein
MTSNFSSKLDTLFETVSLMEKFDATPLSARLANGKSRVAFAIGSGGSAISSHFFARCRDTLSLGPTLVQTPMELAVGSHGLSEFDIWLFSAGADNADIVAAALAAKDRFCGTLSMVTRSPLGRAAEVVRNLGGEVYVVPVSTEKDGYLATHSLIGTLCALLLASDIVAHSPNSQVSLLKQLLVHLAENRNSVSRAITAERLGAIGPKSTIILVADPQAKTVSTLLETSIWEASLCSVQSVDLRNFAHGRHTWR